MLELLTAWNKIYASGRNADRRRNNRQRTDDNLY